MITTEDAVRIRNVDARLAHVSLVADAMTHAVAHAGSLAEENRRAVAELHVRINALDAAVAAVATEQQVHRGVLEAIVAEEAENRRRLHALRTEPSYGLAWSEPDPLVSVCMATFRRAEQLTERALPSVLAQTHEHLQVLVVGDATDDDTADRIAALEDERVTFVNLAHRHQPHDDEKRRWRTASTGPRNEAIQHARGRWVIDADDDDEFRPNHIKTLLDLARTHSAEVAYGRAARRWPDGTADTVGAYPPAFGQFTWMAAIRHAGLSWLNREYVAAWLGQPGDWYLADRLLRIGVRFAMTDEIVCDLYPSDFHAAQWAAGRPESRTL